MTKFRKKPVVIEAVQFGGSNYAEVREFCPTLSVTGIDDEGAEYTRANPIVPTLEGPLLLRAGWWLVRGVQGEFYPVKPSIFAQTYEPAE